MEDWVTKFTRPVTNRAQRRAAGKEVRRVESRVIELEYMLIGSLFETGDEWSYHDVYSFFVQEYDTYVDWLYKRWNFKWVVINPDYIRNKYRPEEYWFKK